MRYSPYKRNDRFIPSRNELDVDVSHHIVTNDLVEYSESVDNILFQRRIRDGRVLPILPYKKKPEKKEITLPRLADFKERRKFDLPDFADDFYLNLLSCSVHNVLAVVGGHEVHLFDTVKCKFCFLV